MADFSRSVIWISVVFSPAVGARKEFTDIFFRDAGFREMVLARSRGGRITARVEESRRERHGRHGCRSRALGRGHRSRCPHKSYDERMRYPLESGTLRLKQGPHKK